MRYSEHLATAAFLSELGLYEDWGCMRTGAVCGLEMRVATVASLPELGLYETGDA